LATPVNADEIAAADLDPPLLGLRMRSGPCRATATAEVTLCVDLSLVVDAEPHPVDRPPVELTK
jgi:hypothetical protein